MPTKPERPCRTCGRLRCGGHGARGRVEKPRLKTKARGYGEPHRRRRSSHLARHPWCTWPGCEEIATVLDHIIRHKGDPILLSHEANQQGLCRRHHNVKTNAEAGRGSASALRIVEAMQHGAREALAAVREGYGGQKSGGAPP